jgi:hypothetical protein
MEDNERVEVLLHRERPDRLPIRPFAYSGFAVVNAGYRISHAYNEPEKTLRADRLCCEPG